MKGRDFALARRLDTMSDHCAISDVSLFELYSGAARYELPLKRITLIEDFAARLKILPFDTEAARFAGPMRYQLEHAGQMIGAYDILIAATALAHGLVVVTNNLREFNRVAGLKVESWG